MCVARKFGRSNILNINERLKSNFGVVRVFEDDF